MSLTPVNIVGGFKKCEIYHINLSEVSDRQLAPSKAFQPQKPIQFGSESEKTKQLESSSDSPVTGNELFGNRSISALSCWFCLNLKRQQGNLH